jgi:hypothetical protein
LRGWEKQQRKRYFFFFLAFFFLAMTQYRKHSAQLHENIWVPGRFIFRGKNPSGNYFRAKRGDQRR